MISAPPRIARRDVAGIVLLAVVVAASVIRNDFTQDDLSIIRISDRLHGLGAWREMLTLPYWPPPASPDLYRPLLSLSLAVQYAIGNGAPAVYRVWSLLLYAASCVAVLHLASRLLPRVPALLAAAIFAVHPLHVEAVTLAVAQSELLVGIAAAFSVAKYIDWRRSAATLGARRWVILAAIYAAASLSKENGLVIPALLICAELAIDDGRWRDRAHRLWPGFVMLAAVGIAILAIRTAVLGGHLAASIAADAIRETSLSGRMLTMLRTVPEWVRLFVWPVHLRAEYSPQELVPSPGFGGREALGLAMLVVIAGAGVALRRGMPVVSLAIAWTAVALLPVANIILPSGVLVAERTLFLPSVGPALAGGALVAWLLARAARPRLRWAMLAACGIIVVAAAVRSISRYRVWQDPRTLTLYSMTDAPRSWRVQQAYGELLFDEGRVADGSAAFERAVRYAPETWRPRNRFAERLLQSRQDERALEQLQRSLAEHPGRIETLVRLPAALLATGQYARARQLADSIIVAEHSPPVMVAYRAVADSAMKLKARPGTVRVFLF